MGLCKLHRRVQQIYNSPVANYKGKLYNLPFNMNTFYQMWGVTTPEAAHAKIEEQKAEALRKMQEDGISEPRNLEEQALLLIGKDIYEKLIKGYTEKQWGRKCTELPSFIIRRLTRKIYLRQTTISMTNIKESPSEDITN